MVSDVNWDSEKLEYKETFSQRYKRILRAIGYGIVSTFILVGVVAGIIFVFPSSQFSYVINSNDYLRHSLFYGWIIIIILLVVVEVAAQNKIEEMREEKLKRERAKKDQ